MRIRPSSTGAWLAGMMLCLLLGVASLAANFPALTGRIVDQAGILPAPVVSQLETKLADLEAKSGIQLVVAVVNTLEGQEIEPYANGLFRFWQLGEKAKNNGVLLLVAPNEKRVRIEVGYGLEGTLTDALSKLIITNAITPRFKSGDFAGGIARGVDDIVAVLTTDSSEWQKRPSLRVESAPLLVPSEWIGVTVFVVVIVLMIVSPGFRWLVILLLTKGRGGGAGRFGGGRSSKNGGGFGGRGGSSGGGGASGGW